MGSGSLPVIEHDAYGDLACLLGLAFQVYAFGAFLRRCLLVAFPGWILDIPAVAGSDFVAVCCRNECFVIAVVGKALQPAAQAGNRQRPSQCLRYQQIDISGAAWRLTRLDQGCIIRCNFYGRQYLTEWRQDGDRLAIQSYSGIKKTGFPTVPVPDHLCGDGICHSHAHSLCSHSHRTITTRTFRAAHDIVSACE